MRAAQRPINTGYIPPRSAEITDLSMPPTRVTSVSSVSPRGSMPLTFDYTYVYRDLRRIAALALFFFGAMIVIWFLIQYTTALKPLGL